ncbi:hypothetical protein EYR36_006951 [Pleurotus pulmonarius]|nr:hypothetical protein EYR36_006951 [Pleurotus pulmonarius]
MPFNFKKIFSKKSRSQTLPLPPILRKSPVVGSSSRGSSPASSCSTLVGAPSIEHKHLTIVQSLHAEPSHDVWLVSHNHTKQHFTLSVYRTRLLTAEQRSRLSDERMMMLLLSESDEFVKIVSHWDEVGEKYILTDYNPYTLADALHEQPFNKGQARLYAAHIVSALMFLHRLDTSHNDVSLSNIHITPTGRPVLGGLGKAVISMRGTPNFVGDIRNLGVCMYKMATNRSPFDKRGKFIPFRREDLVRPTLQHLILSMLSSRISDLQYVKGHRYFAGINWAKIASPMYTGTYNAEAVGRKKANDPSVTVFPAGIAEIHCDWQVAYLKKQDTRSKFAEHSSTESLGSGKTSGDSSLGSPGKSPQWGVNEVICGYTPGYGQSPKYFSSAAREEEVLGSAFED